MDTSAPGYPRNAQFVYDEQAIEPIRSEMPHIQRRANDLMRFKQPPGSVLDIGCGKGEVALALHERGFDCTGIDMKKHVISHLQAHFPQIRWCCTSIADLKAMTERFDVLTMYHVLEHISDPRAALHAVKSLAKPGALMVIEIPNVDGLGARLKGAHWHYYKIDHVSYLRVRDLRRLAAELGLTILGVRGYQHFSYPQNVLWKDSIKKVLGWLGFQDVISVFLRVQ